MEIFYRISDAGYNKVKPDYINNEKCLKNFTSVFVDNCHVNIIADNVSDETYDMICQYVEPSSVTKVSVGHGAGTFNLALDEALKLNDSEYVYFVEDDYLHKRDAIAEMILSYERISSQIGKELIMCPADYPYLYNKLEDSKIILGNNCHWRSIEESLCTFLTSKKIINKHFKKFVSACEFEHYPFEKPFHDIYKKELCISPMPALAVHFTNINSIYGLSPLIDYEKLWKENKI